MSGVDYLPAAFRLRLESMYAGEVQRGVGGPVEIDKITRISRPEGLWLYETCKRLRPSNSLEIGLAYGFSTLYILAAIHQAGSGHHTALDPYQTIHWHGIGALHAKHLSMERSFECIEEPSATALARFAEEKREFEFIFIDGGHLFDEVLMDFTLAAKVCPLEGEIIFDDMWMRSIQTVVHWIRSNRPDFREVPAPVENVAHFVRVGKDERDWRHFVPFRVSRDGSAKRLLRPVVRWLRRL